QAIVDWSQAGLAEATLSALANPKIEIANLHGSLLGLAAGSVIAIDPDAAGHIWFTNPSPSATPPAGQMDLLTVVTHELGHLLGFGDVPAPGIMSGTLAAGVRIFPGAAELVATSPATQPLATLASASGTAMVP